MAEGDAAARLPQRTSAAPTPLLTRLLVVRLFLQASENPRLLDLLVEALERAVNALVRLYRNFDQLFSLHGVSGVATRTLFYPIGCRRRLHYPLRRATKTILGPISRSSAPISGPSAPIRASRGLTSARSGPISAGSGRVYRSSGPMLASTGRSSAGTAAPNPHPLSGGLFRWEDVRPSRLVRDAKPRAFGHLTASRPQASRHRTQSQVRIQHTRSTRR